MIYNNIKFSLHKGYWESTNYIDGKRIQLHRYIWEQNYGVIPEGYIVHHKDSNRTNNSIENLECMSNNAHLKIHYLDGSITKQTEESKRKISKSQKERWAKLKTTSS